MRSSFAEQFGPESFLLSIVVFVDTDNRRIGSFFMHKNMLVLVRCDVSLKLQLT